MDDLICNRLLSLCGVAARKGEVPVSAIIVKNNKIVAVAYNKKERKRNAVCHAEILAIGKASRRLGNWRLEGCEMYVSNLPCCMCAGAIVNSRISKVCAMATSNEEQLIRDIFASNRQNWTPELEIVGDERFSEVLKSFFRGRREKKKCAN